MPPRSYTHGKSNHNKVIFTALAALCTVGGGDGLLYEPKLTRIPMKLESKHLTQS